MNLVHITDLDGRAITRWMATEMALSDGPAGAGPVLWSHSSVPYLQLISIDMEVDHHSVYRMLSQLDDGNPGGFFGLYLLARDAMDRPSDPEPLGIYRTRELTELPLGEAHFTVVQSHGPSALERLDLVIDGRIVSFRAAEVYERPDGSFNISGPDESILVQVDGMMPVRKPHQIMPVHATADDEHHPAPQLPAHLLETVSLLGKAYPHGIPDNEGPAVLRLLYDHMSDRNLADVMAYVTGKDVAFAYNDVLGVPSRAIDQGLLEVVHEKFVRAGLRAWIDAG